MWSGSANHSIKGHSSPCAMRINGTRGQIDFYYQSAISMYVVFALIGFAKTKYNTVLNGKHCDIMLNTNKIFLLNY